MSVGDQPLPHANLISLPSPPCGKSDSHVVSSICIDRCIWFEIDGVTYLREEAY